MKYSARAISTALALMGIVASTAAFASPAASTVALNVRSGPGTGYGVVDTLDPGEVVDVTECVSNGWCHIQHVGPDGWVSSNYLTAAEDASPSGPVTPPSPSECGFGVTIGPNGPTFSVNCGNNPPPPPAPPAPTPPAPSPTTPASGEACFYTGANFTGDAFCQGPVTLNALGSTLNDDIASVRVNGVKAQLCSDTNLNGTCRTYDSNAAHLDAGIRNKASSLKVFKGFIILPQPLKPLPLGPKTFSTGPIDLKQTYMANLDNGQMTQVGADIWYQAKTATSKFITPVKGASLAVGNKSNRGYNGCKTESYSTASVPLWQIPPGSYVCVKTNEGRISQFRVNGYVGTTLKLGYTTWSN